MFAGLPGVGVGTLFYVLAALWMPIVELHRLLRGDSSAARWRLVMIQWCFAVSMIASIAIADRLLVMVLRAESITQITPAALINQTFAVRTPESFWAAPIAASMLLLLAVLLAAEGLRALLFIGERRRSRHAPPPYQPFAARRQPWVYPAGPPGGAKAGGPTRQPESGQEVA